MTDFIGIINSMSKSFQKEVETKKENEKLNLNSDVTLKWRGLHKNQFAAVRKKNNKSEIQNRKYSFLFKKNHKKNYLIFFFNLI